MLAREDPDPASLDDDAAVAAPAPIGAAADLMAAPPISDAANRKNMALLIQFRWIAVIGQFITIMFVQFGLGISLPLPPMMAVLGGLILLNFASRLWLRSHDDIGSAALLLVSMLDVFALTAQLWLSGGANNPFVSLYLLQITMAAVLLDAQSTWLIVALTFTGFVVLVSFHEPLDIPSRWAGTNTFSLPILGMLVCFILNAALLVVFISRITRNLRERDTRLATLKQAAIEEDHVVRIGLLATGAAHELGTPLASLSVILGDWRRMPALASDPELSQDLGEMEISVQRCKSIVTGILLSAGEARGEGSSPTTVAAFLTALVEEWRTTRPSATLYFRNAFGTDLAIVSDVALKQAIFNVLDNAAEVSRDWIELMAERNADKLVLSVTDRGPGFSREMLAHIGKPYQSTKGSPGSGLGLFLVVNVVRKLGGAVTARNRPDIGAAVRLELPLSTLAIGDPLDG